MIGIPEWDLVQKEKLVFDFWLQKIWDFNAQIPQKEFSWSFNEVFSKAHHSCLPSYVRPDFRAFVGKRKRKRRQKKNKVIYLLLTEDKKQQKGVMTVSVLNVFHCRQVKKIKNCKKKKTTKKLAQSTIVPTRALLAFTK